MRIGLEKHRLQRQASATSQVPTNKLDSSPSKTTSFPASIHPISWDIHLEAIDPLKAKKHKPQSVEKGRTSPTQDFLVFSLSLPHFATVCRNTIKMYSMLGARML